MGCGGSGSVYLAEHISLKALRAVKCIHKTNILTESFRKETDVLKSLKHPGIPIIYDIEEDSKYYYIIEEYIQGESLKAIMLNQKFISNQCIIQYAIQICDIIQYLHHQKPAAILYLDLKPEHVIISGNHIKLLDFGTARRGNAGTCVYNMGTDGFAAPEQYEDIYLDERTDVYAVGAILYYMCTGSTIASDQTNVKKDLKTCPAALKKLILDCIAFDKYKRCQSLEKVKNELQKLKKQNKSGGSSLKIAVVGSQARVGCTHFAVAFSIYIKRRGYTCLYKECNKSEFLQSFREFDSTMYEQDGIYEKGIFQGLPEYGKAVEIYMESEILIQDFGFFTEADKAAIDEAEILFAIAGTKPWEMKQKLLLERELRNDKRVIWLANLSLEKADHKWKEIRKGYYQIPFYQNPFLVYQETERLFEKLLRLCHSYAPH